MFLRLLVTFLLVVGSISACGDGGSAMALDECGDSVASTSCTLSANGTEAGTINIGGDIDYYAIEISSSGILTLYTQGEVDTVGVLYHAPATGRGDHVAANDNAGEGKNFHIKKEVTPGTYYIHVRGLGENDTGNYTLVGEFALSPWRPQTEFSEATVNEIGLLYDEFLSSLPVRAGNAQKINFYYEINSLINATRIYTNPLKFGSPDIVEIENYLITLSEAYFKPCNGYDFYNDAPRNCRSPERVGKYYLWRSPLNNTEIIRIAHAKVEWRAVAGISQAVIALLRSNDPNIRKRAQKVKELIYKEVWIKWHDIEYIESIGLSSAYAIQNASVLHYLSWIELIVDLLKDEYPVTSVIEKMKDYVVEGEFINFRCRPVDSDNQSCRWRGYQLGDSKSNDLSHLAIPVYVFERQGLYVAEMIKTLKEKTWSQLDGFNYPKFDMFFNGHCKDNYDNSEDGLYKYCNTYWFTEEKSNNSHRQLFGFVELGKYDIDLAKIYIQAADTNNDGTIDSSDILVKDYVVNLYEMIIDLQSR